jgi:hypothetical protein
MSYPGPCQQAGGQEATVCWTLVVHFFRALPHANETPAATGCAMRTLHRERPRARPRAAKQGQHQLHAHMAVHDRGQQAPMVALHAARAACEGSMQAASCFSTTLQQPGQCPPPAHLPSMITGWALPRNSPTQPPARKT